MSMLLPGAAQAPTQRRNPTARRLFCHLRATHHVPRVAILPCVNQEIDPAQPLQPLRPDVIDEEFEGEAVLVQLRTGCYYALNDAGTATWRALSGGRSAAAVAAGLALDPEPVAAFLSEMVAEQLVEPAVDDLGSAGLEAVATRTAAPELQRFTDMQELLLLDPIHDIDLNGDGWPVAPDPA